MICPICGAEFERTENRGTRKYCSRKCYFRAHYRSKQPKQAKQKTCPMCGKKFETFYGQRKFCSAKCRNKWNNIKSNAKRFRSRCSKVKQYAKRICLQCGKEFELTKTNKKFCSRLCGRRYRRGFGRKIYVKTCPMCGKKFETETGQQVYCSVKCRKRAEKQRARRELPTFAPPPAPPLPKVEVVKPIEPPRRKVIIPAAEAENRKPTVEELLDWIFSKEQTA